MVRSNSAGKPGEVVSSAGRSVAASHVIPLSCGSLTISVLSFSCAGLDMTELDQRGLAHLASQPSMETRDVSTNDCFYW